LVDESSTQCPRCAALQVLGLETDTTETEIRSAYRLLVKTWQPDRFQGDPKLKEAAEQKLKEIKSAFEVLTATSIERGMPDRPANEAPYRAFQQAAPIAEPAGKKAAPTVAQSIPAGAAATIAASGAIAAPAAIPNAIPPAAPAPPAQHLQKVKLFYRRARLLFGIAAIVFVLLTGKSIWTVFKAHDAAPQAAQPAPQSAQPAPQNAEVSQAEKTRAAYRLTLPAPRNPDSRPPEKTGAATNQGPPAPHHVLLPYLTVGSTKAEVLAQQGTPTASSEDKLVYGKSELYLKDGAVVGWRIDPVSSPIRVKLWPEAAVDPGLDFFSYGSSKDSVLVVQGTPTAFTEDKFEYGGSVVYFRNNRVYSWRNDPASIQLRAR
jgi:hypothetical protein